MKNKKELPLEHVWVVWKECLSGNDPNAIFEQISRMTWDAAIFRLVLESRSKVLEKYPDDPPLNTHFHALLDRSFFQSQAATIRRVADKSRYGLDGKRGIYSLYALIEDIESHREALTRKAFFTLRELPYDYLAIQLKEQEFINNQTSVNNKLFILVPLCANMV